MFHPKLRRVLASTALVSALSLLPVRNAGAEPRARRNSEGGAAAERIAVRPSSFWELLSRLLAKISGQSGPDVTKIGARIDPDGNH
jgi:hypothetical protein